MRHIGSAGNDLLAAASRQQVPRSARVLSPFKEQLHVFVVQASRLPGQARRLRHKLFLDRQFSPCLFIRIRFVFTGTLRQDFIALENARTVQRTFHNDFPILGQIVGH